jgi:hypothetical protein
MKKLLFLIIIGIIFANTACQQGKNNKIAESVKSYILKDDSPYIHAKIDTLTILRNEMITEKEMMSVLVSKSENSFNNAVTRIKYDFLMIDDYKKSIKEDSESVEFWKKRNKPAYSNDDLKKLKDVSLKLNDTYSELQSDSLYYLEAKKNADSLSQIFEKADNINKENYLTLIHLTVSTLEGGKTYDGWFYLDKNYKTVYSRENK